MNPSKLSKSVLERIEQEKITPRSRVYFAAKNIGFWGLFGAAMLAGAVSVALILYAANNTDFAVQDFVEEAELLKHWLTLLPVIWILLVGVAIGIGMVGLKHTKRGYRIALFALVGSNVFGSIILGGGLYAAGGGEIIEEAIEENIKSYQGVRDKHQRFWGNPQKTGRLAGRIKTVNEDEKTITLEGPYGRTWQVEYNEAQLPKNVRLEPGKIFKMKGQANAEGHFKPRGLRPANRQERMHRKAEQHIRRNPELRRQFEQHLKPETKAQLKKLQKNHKQPSPKLREQIREEVKANTTPEQRQQLRRNVRESIKSERMLNKNTRLQRDLSNNRFE